MVYLNIIKQHEVVSVSKVTGERGYIDREFIEANVILTKNWRTDFNFFVLKTIKIPPWDIARVIAKIRQWQI